MRNQFAHLASSKFREALLALSTLRRELKTFSQILFRLACLAEVLERGANVHVQNDWVLANDRAPLGMLTAL